MAQGMRKLNEALAALPEVRELLLSLDAGTSPIAVSGLSGVHRAQLTAAVRHKTQRPLLIVCADENEANRMAGDLHELLGEDVSLLFAREWQLRDRVFASHGWEQQRIGSLCSLAAGKAPILVATVDGLAWADYWAVAEQINCRRSGDLFGMMGHAAEIQLLVAVDHQ